MRSGRPMVVVAAVLLTMVVGPVARAETEQVELTFQGPSYVPVDAARPFTGVLQARTAAGVVGLPNQYVDVTIDGAPAASTVTGPDGSYVVQLTFPSYGQSTVVARAYAGTPLQELVTRTVETLVPVSVRFSGRSAGARVRSTPAGIDCPGACNGRFMPGTEIALTATPGPTAEFDGWSGGPCSGTGTCTLVAEGGPILLTAVFADRVVPAPPTLVATSPVSPANHGHPRLRGSAEAGSTVRIYDGAPCSGTPIGEGGAETFASPGIMLDVRENAVTQLYATATDEAGNTSSCAGGLVYVEDSTGPAPPVPAAAYPAAYANDDQPEIAGTAEPGSTVRLYTDVLCSSTVIGEGTAERFGGAGIIAFVPEDAETTIHATATDAAGNGSGCSHVALRYTEDSSAAAPVFTATAPTSPGNDNTPRFVGVVEPVSTVTLYPDAGCAGAPIASGSDVTFASPGIEISVEDDSATTVYARVVDRVGNVSACSAPASYVEDSTPPDLSLTTTVPAGPANDNAPLVLGSAEAGTTVRFYLDPACAGPVAGSGAAEALPAGISISVPDDATSSIRATTTDAAGNASACVGPLQYIEDSTALPPVISGTSPGSPANDNAPEVVGTAEAGSTVAIYDTSDCSGDPLATGTAAAFASPGITVAVADDTSVSLRARVTDRAGNVSACSAARSYVEDSTPPAAATITRSSPASPANTLTPTIIGTAAPGTEVRLFSGTGCVTIRSAWVAAGTFFNVDASGATPNGVTTYYVGVRDAAGNVGPCSPSGLDYRHDSIAPTFAGVASVAPVSQTSLTVTWAAATDSVAASEDISYELCWNSARGTCTSSFSAMAATARGALAHTIGGLNTATRYHVVVRARDTALNRESNVVERDVRTLTRNGASEISAGGMHACAALAAGGARCWGGNVMGQVGDGTTDNRVSPVLTGDTSLRSVDAGDWHTCAIDAGGAVRCWGSNTSGQLGDGTTVTSSLPVAAAVTDVVAVSAGGGHTCAVTISGAVRCWGANDAGQLGDGTTTSSTSPVAVAGITSAVAVSAGETHTCAVLANGDARCWGANASGQLGDGTTTGSSTPVAVGALAGTVTQIAAGKGFTCARLASGAARCWGANDRGQLGDGTTTGSATPVDPGLTGVEHVTAGATHACALTSAGARCWGANASGQLGDGTTTERLSPVSVSMTGVEDISAGGAHTCMRIVNGNVLCWGANGYGSLGDGTTADRASPQQVASLEAFVGPRAIAAGSAHTCASASDGVTRCWGSNASAQLGDGTFTTRDGAVAATSDTSAVAASLGFSCSLGGSASVRCWGANTSGQLGDGTTTTRTTPTTVSGLSNAVAIDAGISHTCAVTSSGGVRCWGANASGQIGDGTTTNRTTPTDVASLTGARAVAAGSAHSCALIADGTVRCWGLNSDGQLGDGTLTQRASPVQVSGLTDAVAIVARQTSTCALVLGGTVRCWGANTSGQLGDGTTTRRTSPVTVSGLTGAVSVSMGWAHACATAIDGAARCWGNNDSGELGNDTRTDSTTPVTVVGLSGATAIAAGGSSLGHTCALELVAATAGRARCWGSGGSSVIGDGASSQRSSPTAPVRDYP